MTNRDDAHAGGSDADGHRATDRHGVTVSRDLPQPPAAVIATLLRATTFPLWVVGPGRVVDVDDAWPAIGSGFVHETGRGPLKVRDRTTLEYLDRETGRISLLAFVRPAGQAAIQIHVVDRGGGSRVTMHERPVAGPGSWLPRPLYRPALRLRNLIALRRLERVVAAAQEGW